MAIKFEDLGLQHLKLSAKGGNTPTRHARQAFVTTISDDIEQLLNTMAPNWCNNPEFGKMGSDRVDHRGLLTNEQMAGAVEHQTALLLACFGCNKPHVCAGDRFTNGLGVSGIVLLPLDIGLSHRPAA